MPDISIDSELTIYYEDHYFGEAWLKPEVIVLLHGVAESSRAWDQWVPHLSRRYRVIRPDLRGFGRSSIPSAGYHYSIDGFAQDLSRFLTALSVDSAHVVGAKIGGTIALQFASDYPSLTRSVAIFSGPVRSRNTGGQIDLSSFQEVIRTKGVRAWAAETQRARLGSEASEAQVAYWNDFMGESDLTVNIDVQSMVRQLDISEALERIKASVLVATTERSSLASVEVVREWQERIQRSELTVLSGDSYHLAAVRPDECAEVVLDFIHRQGANGGSFEQRSRP